MELCFWGLGFCLMYLSFDLREQCCLAHPYFHLHQMQKKLMAMNSDFQLYLLPDSYSLDSLSSYYYSSPSNYFFLFYRLHLLIYYYFRVHLWFQPTLIWYYLILIKGLHSSIWALWSDLCKSYCLELELVSKGNHQR